MSVNGYGDFSTEKEFPKKSDMTQSNYLITRVIIMLEYNNIYLRGNSYE